MVKRRARHPGVEPAERGHGRHRARRINAINLPRLPARPDVAVAIEGNTFRMIEPRSEHFESRTYVLLLIAAVGAIEHRATSYWLPLSCQSSPGRQNIDNKGTP